MFFFFVPFGADVSLRRRPFVCIVLTAMILYRGLLAHLYRALRIPITDYLPPGHPVPELGAAVFQSLFTPAVGYDGVSASHLGMLHSSFIFIAIFWIVLGPVLEDLMGRWGLAALYLATGLAGAVPCYLGAAIALVPTYWLGLFSTLFFIGIAYYVAREIDVKVAYVFLIIPIVWKTGRTPVPAALLLAALHLYLCFSHSLLFFPKRLLNPTGPVIPFIWLGAIPVIGFVCAWAGARLAGAFRPRAATA